MGKGDKKSRRGKIILGTFGVRRPRKKSDKPEIKQLHVADEKLLKERRPVKEIKEAKEIKVAKEKTEVKESKVSKDKKEVKVEKAIKAAKPKKEKKS